MVFSRLNLHHHCVDRPWALFQLLGHLATGREHCNDHRDFSNGISDTELAEPDARAIHLKLEEIIRSIQPARNEMIDIENLSDEELQALSKKFEAIRAESQARIRDS